MAKSRHYHSGRALAVKHQAICPFCGGRGLVGSSDSITRARQGGIATVVRSRESGQLSMQERGRRGGAPLLPRIEGLAKPDQARPSIPLSTTLLEPESSRS